MTETININPYGMCLDVNIDNQNKASKILIFLIGPFSNILLLLIIISVWWCFPVVFFYTRDFAFANFILGFFNLIPLCPLDGGNVILSCISTIEGRLRALKIMKKISIILGVIFLILFIWSCFYVVNFSCFCISFFMLSSVLSYKEIVNKEIKNKLSGSDIKQHKVYVIKPSTNYESIKECFDDNSYVQFYLLNDENKIVKIFSQDEIREVFKNHLTKLNH
jgi:stage IV sporulation protein FB